MATPRSPIPVIPDYQLIRLIGQGSYGDVWLARGVTGLYRAIKIIWRARFSDAAPFDREFKGLKEFAAISLGESIQLALLHIGRNDEAGFFYYVMELADDAERGRDIDPASYVPLTLTELRRRRGRVPAADCVNHGVELARVLAGLHRRGLVHRDIKPSNVILVSGVAKLADIGLVTTATEARTYIGTEGFVPPEGPGAPGADVYALGKLLYELSTGLDRQEFPQLPRDVARLPDHALLLELNEINLRACETNPANRYADGAAVLADLQALQDGTLARSRHRRWLFRRIGVAVLLAALIVAAWYWWQRPVPPVAVPAAAVNVTPAVISPRSIAVLPFENFSDDKANAYFADGVYDDILTNLANLSPLRVIGRTSMLQYRATTKPIHQIAAELGVAYVLEGSVRRAGAKVRLTGKLIRAATQEQVWARTYDRDLTDVFAIQSELSREIASALNGVLTTGDESVLARRPTQNLAAYDLYQRARALEQAASYDPKDAQGIVALYEQAVQLDPNYAEAWARMGVAGIFLGTDAFGQPTPGQLAKSRAAIARADQLAPDDFAVLMSGASLAAITGDRAEVNRRRQRIAELFPHRAEARFVAGLTAGYENRWEDSLTEYRAAQALDPHNVELLGNMEEMLRLLRRYDEWASILAVHHALAPGSLEVSFTQALVPFYKSGSTAELKAFVANLPADPEFADRKATSFRAQVLFMLGDAAGVVRLWREAGPRWIFDQSGVFDDLSVGIAFLALNDPASARPLLERSRNQNRAFLAKAPHIIPRRNLLGLSLALLGEEAAARSTLAEVREQLHNNKEHRDDPGVLLYNSLWRAWVGEKAEAVAMIDRVLKQCSGTYHAYTFELRTSLFAKPLQGDPAFVAVLDEPANNAPVYGNKPAASAGAPVAASVPTIAVLEFENLSDSKDNAYIAEGIRDDILTSLADVRALRVISRESVKRYRETNKSMKEIGTELGADYILGGSVRREGDEIRLNAHLIEVRTDTEIWAKRFDRPAKELLKLEGDVATEVVPALQIPLTPGEKAALAKSPTASAEAYELYLQAQKLFRSEAKTDDWFQRTESLLEQAVKVDPDFLRGWLMLISMDRIAYHNKAFDTSDARIAKADHAGAEARRLAPNVPEVLVALGEIRHYLYQDYDGAMAYYRQALATHPNYADAHSHLGYLYRRKGRWADALAEFREAWKGAPGDRRVAGELYYVLMLGQYFPEMVEMQRKFRSYWPLSRDDDFNFRFDLFASTGDTTDLDQWLAAIPAAEQETPAMIDHRLDIAGLKGDATALIGLIRRYGLTGEQINHAGVLLWHGDHELLQQQLDKWKPAVEKLRKEAAQNPNLWADLARYEALRGDRAAALLAMERARQLMPESTYVSNGQITSSQLIQPMLWLGEKEAAIAEIQRMIRLPHGIHAWELEHEVIWETVRNDPRIQALIKDPQNREPLF